MDIVVESVRERLLDATIELGTNEGTSADRVELVCVDHELVSDVVTRVVVDDDEVAGQDSIVVARDDTDEVEDDDVDEGI